MSLKSKTGAVLTKDQIGITHSTIGATLVANCNSATDVNVEYYTNNATENKPTDTGTYLVWCHKINSSTMTQFATLKANQSALYMRQYNGSWSDWVVVTRPLDVYPVGSVYQSSESTNPAQYFGGTWTQISSVETCTLHGTIVVNPSSRMYASLFTLTQVQTMLHDAFGIDTADITADNVWVDASDCYWDTSNHAVLSVFFAPGTPGEYFAFFSGSTSSAQRIQYLITYNREMYKFVRSA